MAVSANTRSSLPPPFLLDINEWKRAIGSWALEVNQGHIANTGIVTLTVNAQSTTVTDARAGAFSFIGFMPTTANAATEYGAGVLFVSTRRYVIISEISLFFFGHFYSPNCFSYSSNSSFLIEPPALPADCCTA